MALKNVAAKDLVAKDFAAKDPAIKDPNSKDIALKVPPSKDSTENPSAPGGGAQGGKAGKLDFIKLRRLLIPAVIALVLDLVTKSWALSSISPYGREAVTGFFNLVLVSNQGAAFSLLSGEGSGQGLKMTALALVAMLPLAWFYLHASCRDRALLTGLGLVLGGGAGNVCDRLRYGAVVDFLDFHLGEVHWPAFNMADVAVCAGAGLLALSVLFGRGPTVSRGRSRKNLGQPSK